MQQSDQETPEERINANCRLYRRRLACQEDAHSSGEAEGKRGGDQGGFCCISPIACSWISPWQPLKVRDENYPRHKYLSRHWSDN